MRVKYKKAIKLIVIFFLILFLMVPLVKYILDEYFFEDIFVYVLNHVNSDYNVEIIHSGKSTHIEAKKNDITNKTWAIRKQASVHEYKYLVSIYSPDDRWVYFKSISWIDGAFHTAGAKGDFATVIDILEENGEIKVFYSSEIFRHGDPRD